MVGRGVKGDGLTGERVMGEAGKIEITPYPLKGGKRLF